MIINSWPAILWFGVFSGAVPGFGPSLTTVASTLDFCFAEASVKANTMKYVEVLEDQLRR